MGEKKKCVRRNRSTANAFGSSAISGKTNFPFELSAITNNRQWAFGKYVRVSEVSHRSMIPGNESVSALMKVSRKRSDYSRGAFVGFVGAFWEESLRWWGHQSFGCENNYVVHIAEWGKVDYKCNIIHYTFWIYILRMILDLYKQLHIRK